MPREKRAQMVALRDAHEREKHGREPYVPGASLAVNEQDGVVTVQLGRDVGKKQSNPQ